jgi:dTMP kinase
MKIIAFEGIDACGKETQAELLTEWLREQGCLVFPESFPRYFTEIGKLIKAYLRDEIELTEEAAVMLFEVDKQDFQSVIHFMEEEQCDFIVLDRYVLSNLAFGVAKGLDIDWLRDLQKKIRKPDITFILDISPETSVQRRSEGRDKYEQDLALLEKARNSYLDLASTLQNEGELIFVINGERDPEEVQAEIQEVLIKHLT